jgi:hypothetical protein
MEPAELLGASSIGSSRLSEPRPARPAGIERNAGLRRSWGAAQEAPRSEIKLHTLHEGSASVRRLNGSKDRTHAGPDAVCRAKPNRSIRCTPPLERLEAGLRDTMSLPPPERDTILYSLRLSAAFRFMDSTHRNGNT